MSSRDGRSRLVADAAGGTNLTLGLGMRPHHALGVFLFGTDTLAVGELRTSYLQVALAIGVGIGLFITIIGLVDSGIARPGVPLISFGSNGALRGWPTSWAATWRWRARPRHYASGRWWPATVIGRRRSWPR